MNKFLLGIVSCVLFSGCITLSEKNSVLKEENKRKIYICKKITEKIRIDGILNEKVWEKAIPVREFYEIVPRENILLPYKNAEVRFLYDDKFLYIGAIINDEDIVADPESPKYEKTKLFLEGDTFEVFIQPEEDNPTYFEFHVNPVGAMWDARFIAQRYMKFYNPANWDSNMIYAVKYEGTLNKIDKDKGWTVEMAIPFSSLRNKDGKVYEVKRGTKWRVSISLYDFSYYYDNGGSHSSLKYVSSSKLKYLDFHRRQDYNFLEFE